MVDILLVDDRPDGLMAMEAVLGHEGYNLVQASSGHEALASLYDHDYAVILLDVQMPVMDGFETARLIKQYAPARETPIIFVTAISKETHHIARGYESGAVDYLFKPFDPNILLSKVKIFVELYQARQFLAKTNETLELKVKERTAELTQINRELEQFAYVASHDLQEPLRKIITFSGRLQESFSAQLDEVGRDYLDRMHKAGTRMKTVIEDLLHFSRINAKDIPYEATDLKEIIMDVISDLEIKIAQQKAEIIIEDLPTVTANKSQLRHLFQNLILNSIKFSKKDQSPRIVINSQVDNEFAIIDVRDNGIGFDEKYLDRIFKPFQRLHGKNEYEGSGIGLSICQKIAQQHGGHITAKSTPGEGATFIITLPLAPVATPV